MVGSEPGTIPVLHPSQQLARYHARIQHTESVKWVPSVAVANCCHCSTYEAAMDYIILSVSVILSLRVTYAVVRAACRVSDERGNLSHRLDTDDAFDCQVRLVGEAACEVICADLVRGDERVRDEELRPLVQQVELGVGIVNSCSNKRVRKESD